MSVCFECCVLSGRSLCVGPITRPEDTYQVWSVELSVISKPQRCGGVVPLRLFSHVKKKFELLPLFKNLETVVHCTFVRNKIPGQGLLPP